MGASWNIRMEFPGIILDTSAFTEVPSPDQHTIYDMLVLGGGPAAMSAAVYAARKMLNISIITLNFGGQLKETSFVENYLGFQTIHANDLVSRFDEQVKSFSFPIGMGVAIKEVRKEDSIFSVLMEDGTRFSGRTIIFATGERHRRLKIPGEEEFMGRGVSYCATCDAPLYKEKKVLVVGGGNSAFTTALDLSRGNAELILANVAQGWQADAFLREKIRRYEKAELLDLHELVAIEGMERVESAVLKDHRTGEEKMAPVDGIFIEIGLLPNSRPAADLVKLNEVGEVVIDCLCRTNVPGFFAAGDVTTVPHKQIIISAGEGAKAALTAYTYLVETSQI
jgi:alkyl hydroperoxide reductase subunit F